MKRIEPVKGLYIHIPFCKGKCHYCDFTSFDKIDEQTVDYYISALCKEIGSLKKCELGSIFFGGGTPTYLKPRHFEQMFLAINQNHIIGENCEITMESNPNTLTLEKIKCLKEFGVNRFSIGLQSYSDRLLKTIGRAHSILDFQRSYDMVKTAGITNVNVDIMYGLPTQKVKDFQDTLQAITNLASTHLSAYELNLSDACPMSLKLQNKDYALPSEEEVLEMTKLLKYIPYNRYEVSNYCKSGFECKHNLLYWYNGQYEGVGLGAHGARVINEQVLRYNNTNNLKEYIDSPISYEHEEIILPKDNAFETLMLGLRLVDGVNVNDYNKRHGIDLENLLMDYLAKNGELISISNNKIALSEKGMDIQNRILVDIMELMQ